MDMDMDIQPTSRSIPARDPPLTLQTMPPEVLIQIAVALPCREFGRFLQLNRLIFSTVNSHYVWHRRFVSRFGQRLLESHSRAVTPPPKSLSSLPPSPREPPLGTLMNSSSNNSLGEAIFDAYHNHHDPQSNSAISSLSSTPIHSGASSPFFNPLHVHNHTPSLPGSDSEDAALEGRQEIGRLTREKGKGRKVDLRRTKDVPRAELVELYKHYSKTLLPARDISIHHIGNRYWVMADSKQSQFSEVAELKSVWWMDVSAMFYGVPPGKYKVQWRVSLTSDGPVINSEFRTILFDQEEDISDVVNYPSTTLFQPKSIQEFMTHTDSTVTNVNRKPFRKLFSKEFTTLELPDELVVEDNYQGVFVQIRNHDGWKSGLFIDYVRLVDVDDPTRVLQSTVYRKVEDSVLDDVVNDEGEEYYPSAANSWIHNMLRTPEAQIERAFQRSRAYRQVEPIDPHAVEVEPQPQSSARALSSSSSSTSRSSAARPQTRYNVDPNNAPPGQQFSGYILFALMILLLYFFSDN